MVFFSFAVKKMTDDPLAKNQLNLWEKLNRLYGDESDSQSGEKESPGKEPAAPDQETHPEENGAPGSHQKEIAGEFRPNKICVECDRDCKQPEDNFILAHCLKAVSETEIQGGTQGQSVRSSMGYEKINETCKVCCKSCKQTARKLNTMLCLGFEPLAPGEESP